MMTNNLLFVKHQFVTYSNKYPSIQIFTDLSFFPKKSCPSCADSHPQRLFHR